MMDIWTYEPGPAVIAFVVVWGTLTGAAACVLAWALSKLMDR